jgi:hypothetical protein
MKQKPKIEECFALDLADGEFPPGVWATGGRFKGEYGVFLGEFSEVQGFLPEARIGEAIADLKQQGELHLAAIIEGIRGDVTALRTGRMKLVRDLAGRRI